MTATVARLQALARRRLLAAAVLLQGEHKRDLSKTYPPASRPGQFPAARTLNLRDSVAVAEIPDGYRSGYTGNAEYILTLVKRGRLSVADTARRIVGRLRRVVRGG